MSADKSDTKSNTDFKDVQPCKHMSYLLTADLKLKLKFFKIGKITK